MLNTIVRKARDYTTASGIAAGQGGYGADVITNVGGLHPNQVTYDFVITKPGDYELWIEYASLEHRPCGIYWDGRVVVTGRIESITGGWYEADQRWEKQGVVAVSALTGDLHGLLIARGDGPIPHIRAIKLVNNNDKAAA